MNIFPKKYKRLALAAVVGASILTVAGPQPASAAIQSFGQDADDLAGDTSVEEETFTCDRGFDGWFGWGGDELDGFKLVCEGEELDDFGADQPTAHGLTHGVNCNAISPGEDFIDAIKVRSGDRIDGLKFSCTDTSAYFGTSATGGTQETICEDKRVTSIKATSALHNGGRRIFGLQIVCNEENPDPGY